MSSSGSYCNGGGNTPGAVIGLITDDSVVVPINPATGDITIHGGPGIITTGNAGTYTVTINSTAVGSSWSNTTSNTSMISNVSYFCSGGANLILSLPLVSTFGDEIEIVLDGSTSFSIHQAAGQQIRLGSSTTTLGTGGSLTSTQQGDSVRMVCKIANTLWTVLSVEGNLTVV